MSEWKEYSLADAAQLVKHPYMPNKSEDLKYIGLEHIEENSLRLNSIGSSLSVTSNKFKFEKNDILFGKLRPYFRKVVITDFDGICSTDIWVIRAKNGWDQKFMFYFFANKDFVDLANSADTGTRMPRADWDFVKNSIWNFPSYDEQVIVGKILSSLDDKIDLLTRQNKILEQLAETYFRQWFVEDSTSKVAQLGEYVDCVNGYSYKGTELKHSENALVTLKNFNRNGGFRLDGYKEFTGKVNTKQIVKEGDLVVAHTDITQDAEIIGNPALVIGGHKYKNLVITMDLVKVIPKSDFLPVEYLYFLMKSREFKFHCLGYANGTTVLHLDKIAIPSFDFCIPSKEQIVIFKEFIRPIMHKLFLNYKVIDSTVNIRDTLLPKLMSGKIEIKA